eukprot:2595962-Pyramimonas_sp.AAC.1
MGLEKKLRILARVERERRVNVEPQPQPATHRRATAGLRQALAYSREKATRCARENKGQQDHGRRRRLWPRTGAR